MGRPWGHTKGVGTMASKILLVNCQQADAERLKRLGFEVDRGHYSDAVELQKVGALSSEKVYSFLPDSIEKYKIVIVNLNYNTAIETEFRQKRKIIEKTFRTEFNKYWNDIGIMIIFHGDYKYDGLSTLGIFHIKFTDREQNNSQVNCLAKVDTELGKVLNEIKGQLLPGNKALVIRDNAVSGENWEIRKAYDDGKGNLLGCYFAKNGDPRRECPRFIILPQAKDNVLVAERLLRKLATIYPGHLPELEGPNWRDTGTYYPEQLLEYDKKLLEYKKKLEGVIKALTKRKTESKKDFETLRSILYQVDEDLKNSVSQVLRRFWSLTVVDMGESSRKGSHKDILIEHGSRKILATIHGTRDPSPSPRLIAQAWQHLHHSGLGIGVEPALIVNYDADTDPKDRETAYIRGYEELLEGLIFIDTRVLFELSIGILDEGLSLERAKEILFRTGRVGFA
jgi:hypothetical protein